MLLLEWATPSGWISKCCCANGLLYPGGSACWYWRGLLHPLRGQRIKDEGFEAGHTSLAGSHPPDLQTPQPRWISTLLLEWLRREVRHPVVKHALQPR